MEADYEKLKEESKDLQANFQNKIEQFTKVHVKEKYEFEKKQAETEKMQKEYDEFAQKYQELLDHKWENEIDNEIVRFEIIPDQKICIDVGL